MRRMSLIFVTVLFCLSTVAMGQPANTAQATPKPVEKVMPKCRPVLERIPAGALGFVVVNNIRTSSDHVDKYLTAIGATEMLQQQMPDGFLDMITKAARLSEGFNPNGGFAAVMLDPEEYNFDLVGVFDDDQGDEVVVEESAKEEDVPVVMFIPGTSVAEVFANYERLPAGRMTKVKLRMGECYAAKVGDYIAVSPSQAALSDVMEISKSAAATLDKKHLAMIAQSDAAVYVNMKVAGPIIQKVLKKVEAEAATTRPTYYYSPERQFEEMFRKVLPFYQSVLSQLESVTMTVRITETAVLVDQRVSFDPQSSLGKILAAYKAPAQPLVARLPNQTYFLMFGGESQATTPEQKKMMQDLLKSLLDNPALSNVTKDVKDRADKLLVDTMDQAESVRLVLGGAPKDSGLFGVACVIGCKDSAAFKKLLLEDITLTETLLKQAADSKDVNKLKLIYTAKAETIAKCEIDTIQFTHPEMPDMSATSQPTTDQAMPIQTPGQMLAKAFGEDKIVIRLATPDKNTLVMTFGGAKPFMADALASLSKNAIGDDPEVAAAMKVMPKNLSGIVLFNGGNLYKLIVNAVQEFQPGAAASIPFQFTAQAPIAVGSGVDGADAVSVFYIPNAFVKNVMDIVKIWQMQMGGY